MVKSHESPDMRQLQDLSLVSTPERSPYDEQQRREACKQIIERMLSGSTTMIWPPERHYNPVIPRAELFCGHSYDIVSITTKLDDENGLHVLPE